MIICGKMIQLLSIPKTEFTMCFQHWQECWNKCICDRGDCWRDFKDHPCKHSYLQFYSQYFLINHNMLRISACQTLDALYCIQWTRLDGVGELICTPTSEL